MHAHNDNRMGAMRRYTLQPSILQNWSLKYICIRSHFVVRATMYNPHETEKEAGWEVDDIAIFSFCLSLAFHIDGLLDPRYTHRFS